MAIGLEAKGYKEYEMKAENITGIAKKVAKRGERAQELSHKALAVIQLNKGNSNLVSLSLE
jgi:hypothetical protein